jgi:hypothetical protein
MLLEHGAASQNCKLPPILLTAAASYRATLGSPRAGPESLSAEMAFCGRFPSSVRAEMWAIDRKLAGFWPLPSIPKNFSKKWWQLAGGPGIVISAWQVMRGNGPVAAKQSGNRSGKISIRKQALPSAF